MSRQPRIIVPGLPHLVTIRGARPLLFRGPDDYQDYRRLLRRCAALAKVRIVSYVLMPGHVHLIAVPETAEGLARALGEAGRQFARGQRARHGLEPPIFKDRFHSVALDDEHLGYALRYVGLNPTRARLVRALRDWPWSSLTGLLKPIREPLVDLRRLQKLLPEAENMPWEHGLLPKFEALRAAVKTGRPLGSEAFLAEVEERLGRRVRAGKRGRKGKAMVESEGEPT